MPRRDTILGLADGGLGAADILGDCAIEGERARRALFVLVRAGLLSHPRAQGRFPRHWLAPDARGAPAEAARAGRLAAEGDEGLPGREEKTPDRAEALSYMGRAGTQDFYEVLGLSQGAPPPAVRDAYYDIARRFHPDRFREGPLADLHAGMEAAFARATEAYSVLSDPQARAGYQARSGAAALKSICTISWGEVLDSMLAILVQYDNLEHYRKACYWSNSFILPGKSNLLFA